jgi:hypothetical protein
MGQGGVGALGRVVGQAGGADALDLLADSLSGADLTSLLLEALRRRADRLSPADVLRQYRGDRFVAPSTVPASDLRRVEDVLLGALPAGPGGFDVLTLAPVVPLGTHSAVAGVDPRNTIATIRRTEVAADPTNALALEAAVRRRGLLDASPRSAAMVRLAALQRVTRAQRFNGPVSFAHFGLLGVVTAGRDTGDRTFERASLIEHLRFGARAMLAAGASGATVAITRLDPAADAILASVQAGLDGLAGVRVVDAPERESGRAYYRCLCFKVYAEFEAAVGRPDRPGGPVEIGDGGFVDWTAKLLGNAKERLLISGYGLDRLAVMTSPDGTRR